MDNNVFGWSNTGMVDSFACSVVDKQKESEEISGMLYKKNL